MTTNVRLLTGCEGQYPEFAACVQSSGSHSEPLQRWPVVMLSQLHADPACYGRCHDGALITGRRPSDVYGEAARARWKISGRIAPLARSAAAIRAARAAKSAVASTDDATVSLDCSAAASESNNPTSNEVLKKDDTVMNVPATNGDANGDVTSGEVISLPIRLVLPMSRFYRSAAQPELNSVTSPSAEAPVVVGRHSLDAGGVPFSPSKYTSRKRKSPQQEAANRVKKTYDRTSHRTDKLSGRSTSLGRKSWRSPLKNARRTDATRSKETISANDDSKQDDTDNDVTGCDDALPVVPIDEKYASMSIAALDVTEATGGHLQPNSSESLVKKPVGANCSPVSHWTSNSTETLTTSMKRAEQTIFERFINALSLYKPRTSEKHDVVPAATTSAEDDVVPNPVPDAKNENNVMHQNAHEADNEQLATSNEHLPETPRADNNETIDNSMKMPCSSDTITDDSISDRNTAAIQADTVVEGDKDSEKREKSDVEPNEAGKRQNEERKTRGVKPIKRYLDDSDLLVRSRPVRKRQPTIYMDWGYDKYVRSGRKVTMAAKSHGSCLLPPDFDSSQSRSSGAARQSWKTVLGGLDRTSTKAGPGRPKKTKRHYKRRKGTVVQDEVQWTIHKKLLLGGSVPRKPKAASRSKFPRKRKLKSPPKLSAVDLRGSTGKLWTRSMTRIQGTAAEQKNAADTGVTTVNKLKGKVEERKVVVATSSAANLAVPSTYDATLTSNPTCSEASTATTKPESPCEDKAKETISSDTSTISVTTTTTTTTTVKESFESLNEDEAVETALATSPHCSVQHQEAEPEPEPEIATDDVTPVDEASTSTDRSATKMVGSGSTSTTATNTDETKVDEESVEALMHLVKQLQDAVANEKLRKAKEKQKTKRGARNGRPPRSTSADESSSTSSSSNQAAALALGLGPRFNWLENKINTMQANTTTMTTAKAAVTAKLRPLLLPKPRPLLPKPPSVVGSWSSLDAGGGGPQPTTTSTVVVVTTTTTTTSSLQTSTALHHVDVVSTHSSVDVGSHMVQVSPVLTVGQEQQPASQQGDCSYSGGLIPLVIDLEDSTDGFASTTTMTQTAEQSSQSITATALSHVEPISVGGRSATPESTVITEPTAVVNADPSAIPFDLTTSRQPRSVEASVSAADTDNDVVFISQTSATTLADEYRTRYEKYESLCALIMVKDRELAELNDERKRLHQRLVELQRAILKRPTATAAQADGPAVPPPNVAEVVTEKNRDKKKADPRHVSVPTSTATTALAYRRRPAHRGVTSVRVMVKSAQPPTAHSTKINLLRYNSLFCNYDDAGSRRKSSTEVAVSNEDAASTIQATDLTAGSSEQTTKCTVSSEEVSQPPVSSAVPEEPCLAKDDVAASCEQTKVDRPSENVDGGYVSEARPTTDGRMELQGQYQRRPVDDLQTTTVLESCVSRQETAVQNTAVQNTTMSRDGGLPGARTVPDDTQRAARQVADAARHQQFVVATSNEMILTTARGRRDADDQRPVVLSTLRPEYSLVMTSPGRRRSSGAEVEVPVRFIPERRELRPPPPYPHHCLENPHPYSVTAAPGLPPPEQAAGIQTSRSQLDHSAAHMAAAYMYRKKNSVVPRTGYVQPMRAENQVSVVVPSCSGGTCREVDVIGNRQQFADMSSRGQVVSEAMFLGNRMSPPAIPLRVGGVRTSHDQTYYSQRVTSDMAQPRPRINDGYHGNRLSNPQIARSTSDGIHQQLVRASPSSMTNVEQRHVVTVTSSSQRDVIIRHPIEPQPLDKLQHFVGGQQIPPGQQTLDVGDPRLRRLSPHSPRLLTSGPLNNVDGRIHAAGVGGDYSQQDPVAAPLVRDCVAIPEADYARRGAGFSSYQAITGHSPRYPSGATYSAPGPPPSLRRDPNPLQPQPLHGLPHNGTGGPAAAPLDMSGAKHGRYSSLNQSGLQVAVDDRRMNVVGSTPVVAQGYTRLIAPNAHRPEALRRPAATESLRHYAQPDVTPSLSSLSQSQDVHGMSAVPRGPLAFPRGGANQTARVLDHQVGSMRCETCTRRAMFVCSACRKAPYCSVECQAKAWRLRHGAICRRLIA